MRGRTRVAGLVAVAVLTVSSCASGAFTGGGGDGSSSRVDLDGVALRVGSKEFTEAVILGEIARLAVREAGADVGTLATITGSVNARTALTSGQIDLYWEYTGTGWSTHLQREIGAAPRDEAELFDEVRTADAANGVAWLDAAPLNNAYAVAISRTEGERRGMTTMSDWAALAVDDPQAAGMCAAAEFLTRDDGLPGIEATYGVELPEQAVTEIEYSLVPGETARAERCLVGEVSITDGAVASNDLVILDDDRGALIDYNAAVTVRGEVFAEHPQLAELFAPISAALTSEVARGLNERADAGTELPEEVAESWMREQGFIS